MPQTATSITAFALEGYQSTALYGDENRRRFIANIPSAWAGVSDFLPEGYEYVGNGGQTYRLTWAVPATPVRDRTHPDLFDAETRERYAARVAVMNPQREAA